MRGIAYTEYEWSMYRSSISTTKCTRPTRSKPARRTHDTLYVQTPHAPAQSSFWTPGFHTSPHISQAISRSGLRRHAVPGRLGPGPDRPGPVGGGVSAPCPRPTWPPELPARSHMHGRDPCSPASATGCRPGPWPGRIPRTRGTHDMLAVFY